MKRPELLITNGRLAGKRFAVKEGGLRLGRSSSNDIHIPDEQLSRNHCLFEVVGEDGLRVTDLASANGTYLNGRALDGDPAALRVGDLVEVGATVIRVVGEERPPVPGQVDLGLGEGKSSSAKTGRRRSFVFNALLIFAVLAIAGAIAVILLAPPREVASEPKVLVEEEPQVREVVYEKVEANADGIFRYEMTLSEDGVLSVSVDDVPKENRHLTKSAPLGEEARKVLGEILAWKTLKEIDREYVGVEPDPPALSSWTLKVVYSTRARSVRIVNTQEPEAFRAIREQLEAFSKNELGVWALQYSRDRLVALAEEAVALGQSKWNDRDVQYGNVFGAVKAFQEALFYLETVNPKPNCMQAANDGLKLAQEELDRRYRDQRFLANRAINLGEWESAQRELTVLIEMVPDRTDERNREASAKLMDVEKRIKGGKR